MNYGSKKGFGEVSFGFKMMRDSACGGFTLVEILLAAVMLLYGVVFISRGFYSSVTAMKEADLRSQLSGALQDKIFEAASAAPKPGVSVYGSVNGNIEIGNIPVSYALTAEEFSRKDGIYKFSILARWEQGAKKRAMFYEALYPKPN